MRYVLYNSVVQVTLDYTCPTLLKNAILWWKHAKGVFNFFATTVILEIWQTITPCIIFKKYVKSKQSLSSHFHFSAKWFTEERASTADNAKTWQCHADDGNIWKKWLIILWMVVPKVAWANYYVSSTISRSEMPYFGVWAETH